MEYFILLVYSTFLYLTLDIPHSFNKFTGPNFYFFWEGLRKKKFKDTKGDGGVGTFDVGGGPAFIFGSNLPIFWMHA